jgi:protein-export membrane protein SecD
MDQKQRNILLLGLIAVLVIGSWALFWPPAKRITQGLDIQGGLSVILTAKPAPGKTVTASDMDRAELIIRTRIDKLGASETSIQRQGNDSILVQIPGLKNASEALKILGSTGQLEFIDVASITDSATLAALQNWNGDPKTAPKLVPGTYKVVVAGDTVKTTSVGQDPTTGEIEVNLTMDAKGTKAWGDYTTLNVGKQVAIALDGVVKSAPVVQNAITDGRTRISGKFTVDDAKNLKTVLETGALPVTLVPSDSRVVGPTLGQDSLHQGVLAVLIGLSLVALYLIVFYRGVGAVAVTALAVFASIFVGVLALLSRFGMFALSLPGIAGIVLTIGLAADSSILIMERFREEVRMGKSIRSAAKSGTVHAIWTSVDADLVTFVSAVALFAIAIGPVRGFALTLIIGIFCDIAMMVLYKRPVIMILAETVIPKAPAFWGMPKEMVAASGAGSKKGGVTGA